LVEGAIEREGGSRELSELFFCLRMAGVVVIEDVRVVVGSVVEAVRALLYN
jgi:hypothetical protein